MSASLFWKSLVFGILVVFGLAFVTALIPGAEKWPEAQPIGVMVVITLGYLWYIKRQQGADPEAYEASPRARRNTWLASIVVFAFVGVENYFTAEDRQWRVGLSALCGLIVLLGAYRLYREIRSGRLKEC